MPAAWIPLLLLLLLTACGGSRPAPQEESVARVERLVLTDSGGAPAQITPQRLGEELRPGLVLLPGQPLRGRFKVPSDALLRLAYGRDSRAPSSSEGPRRPELRLRLMAGARLLLSDNHRLPGARAQLAWRAIEVDLAPFAGEELTLEVELEGAADGPRARLGVPRLITRRSPAPTVLLITSDTQRADHLGLAGPGAAGVATPVLDALAKRGLLFGDCFSAINVTLPSHASILTGLAVRDTGVIANTMGLVTGARTLAEVFAEEGWTTLAVVSAQHLRHEISGLGQGFDRMIGPLRTSDTTAETSVPRMKAWIEEESGAPVFAWLHLFDAHAPYLPPGDLVTRYVDPGRDPSDPPDQALPADVSIPWAAGVRDMAWIRAQYKSEVTALDRSLAELLDLERVRAGIVAFTADHGEVLGEHGIYFRHEGIFPDTLAVPLILAWPGAPAGRRVERPVSNTDLGRTLLDLAGLTGAEFPGQNLLSEGGGDRARFAMAEGATAAAICKEGYLLILTLRDQPVPPRKPHRVELYDLRKDPGCRSDLIEAEFERAKAMRAELIAWLAQGRGTLTTGSQANLPGLAAELAELGYADGQDAEVGSQWYQADPADPWCRRFED